jgi:D-sedoheptulose 7-phosphate isomerase
VGEAMIGNSDYLEVLSALLSLIPKHEIEAVAELLHAVKSAGNKVWIAGNGGSSATASHFANDLFSVGVPALCLTDNMSLVTMLSNDEGYEYIFSHQLKLLANKDDVVILISTSGLSSNILNARWLWLEHKLVALTGGFGGKFADMTENHINVPSKDPRAVEDAHLAVCHMITALLEAKK